MISPHPTLPFPGRLCQDGCEIDPIRVDPLVNLRIGLNPIAVDVAWIRLLCTKTPADVDLYNARGPERVHGGAESFQKPSAPRRESQALRNLLHRRSMIARRQGA